MKLAKAGYDEETVATADRTALQNMFAEYLIAPPEIAAAGGANKGGMTEEEMDLRCQELELRNEEMKLHEKEREDDMELRKKAEERAEKELLLREQELAIQQQKDKMDERRKESLAGLTKYYGDALKHALPRMGHDPSDYPA